MVSTGGIKSSEFEECRDPTNHILPNESNSGPSGERKFSKENGSQLKTGTNDETSDDEWTDNTARKEAFLSLQSSLSQYFITMNAYTEMRRCMKCNKGGQLLVCSSDACPIGVHKTCLSSAPALDENGKFSCPFCAYFHAISKYQEVKKSTSLARIGLQAFLSTQRGEHTRKKACVRIEENPPLVEPLRLHVNHELLCGDREVSVSDPISTEAGDMGRKVGEASQSPTTDSRHQPIRQPRMRERQFNEKEIHVGTRCSGRFVKHQPQYTCPPIALIGRKRLVWTKAEEEKLKEGVERFSSVDKKGMPWKEILEFGREVFEKSRTTIDLKDKWRNMLKTRH